MASFFKKYLRDMVYLCVIGGLVGWIVYNRNNQPNQALFSELGRSLKAAIHHQENQMNLLFDEIKREAFLYPTNRNTHYEENAKRVKDAVQRTVDQLNQIGYPLFIDPIYEQNHLEENSIQQIKVALLGLADTLAFYTDYGIPSSLIYGGLYSDSASYAAPQWACLSSGLLGSSRIGASFVNLKYRVFEVGITAMEYCYRKVAPQGRLIDGFWMPIISTPRTVLRPGELFEADIFLTAFPPRTDFMSVYVNDKPIEIKDQVAPYRQRFSTAGLHKFDVKIDLTNPITNQVIPFHKTFEVLVVEPCPESR